MGMGGGSPVGNSGAKSGYTSTTVDSDGRHTTKKVERGDGWESVEISSDSPLDIGSMIGQIMAGQV